MLETRFDTRMKHLGCLRPPQLGARDQKIESRIHARPHIPVTWLKHYYVLRMPVEGRVKTSSS